MSTSPAAALYAGLRRAAQAAGHRRLLVLAGSARWTRARARAIHRAAGGGLWVGTPAPAGIEGLPAARVPGLLGSETDLLVYDARAGLDADALGAASGLVRGGGVMVLLVPPLEEWPDFPDPQRARITVWPHPPAAVGGRFIHRLAALLAAGGDVTLWREGRDPPVLPDPPAAAPSPEPAPAPFATADQQRAVEAVERVITGQRRRPVVLLAHRGRGKSAALGLAAARLLASGRVGRVAVTGPHLQAVAAVLRHAAGLLPGARASRTRVTCDAGEIFFVAPDALAAGEADADLVLVDEAAAIATPLLQALVTRFPRLAFATTVHGYEGTGRGFAVRFFGYLDTHTRGWRRLTLEAPVRWAPGDPLEHFVFRALLLDAEPAPDGEVAARPVTDWQLRPLDRDVLAADEALLGQLFGLLVLAHYRTRPADLRHLLDGPNIEVFAALADGLVGATALAAREGGFGPAAARAIAAGRRRPHGHLVPESLAAHLGLARAPRLAGWRILRIAVHPAQRRRGLGSALVERVVAAAAAAGADYAGVAFALDPGLLEFWRGCGFVPVRVSVRRGAASGAHSALMLRPLTAAGEALAAAARGRFAAQFYHQLADPLCDLPVEEVPVLGAGLVPREARAQAGERRELAAFAAGARIHEACLGELWRLACRAVGGDRLGRLQPAAARALVMRALQRRDWDEVAAACGCRGRAQVLALLRRAVAVLLEAEGRAIRGSGAGSAPGPRP